jgi:hypothetical protein
MTVDERALDELIVESQDIQSDALRDTKEASANLVEIHQDQLAAGVDPDEQRFRTDQYNQHRSDVLSTGGSGLSSLAKGGALAATFGGALVALMAGPAAAAGDNTDIMILQTAASLENLAVATYGAALTLDFVKTGNAVVKKFAETTMKQHSDHADAFNALTKSMGGKEQKDPNPKYLQVVNTAKPTLTGYAPVVALAIALETVATNTYNANTAMLKSKDAVKQIASIMGVESQHLATLRAVQALLGSPALIAIPTDLAKLPAAAGSVAFPMPFEGVEMASPPEEGAVK